MNQAQHNSLINDVLVSLHRCLLQYLGECSPWISDDQTEKLAQVTELIRFQHSAVASLEELLEARRYPVDFGLYPTEFTDMQFLSLDYLLKESLTEAHHIEQTISTIATEAAQDVEAKGWFVRVQKIQQEVIANLELLTSDKENKQRIS